MVGYATFEQAQELSGMGLSYHFSFRAPATVSSAELEVFLRDVEVDAQRLGFFPTLVVDAPFDTAERRAFARRVARGLMVEDVRLRGVTIPADVCWQCYPSSGACRLAPEHGVILVVTDERGCESVFGFFRYPAALRDLNGHEIMPVPDGGSWVSGDSVDTPDPRYREIVRRFREAGYLASELDEFLPQAER
jgi:hypothetical protein